MTVRAQDSCVRCSANSVRCTASSTRISETGSVPSRTISLRNPSFPLSRVDLFTVGQRIGKTGNISGRLLLPGEPLHLRKGLAIAEVGLEHIQFELRLREAEF